MGKKFYIDEEFANAVMQYLAKQPYIEVHQFVAGFQELKPALELVERKTEE
jgi:hypothetical protein